MLGTSGACERNKDPILKILKDVFGNSRDVLEIGSGSGKHALYFSRNLPHLTWQPSDLEENLPTIRAQQVPGTLENVCPPIVLDVCRHPWPITSTSAIFSANTLHIMPWESVTYFFRGAGEALQAGGVLCVYGPFRYQYAFTSESNKRFDQHLRQQNPLSGIRNFEAVNQLANDNGLSFFKDYAMPANNQLLVWKRHA
ncbi:MAG: DUF938 domain-containing protein [Mariprofundaceae bacterium]|nr:DUF938 domain-containing protein [Mariprofundaceae bacterium]